MGLQESLISLSLFSRRHLYSLGVFVYGDFFCVPGVHMKDFLLDFSSLVFQFSHHWV